MELRIDINNHRKQFTGIGRDNLCDFQYGVQYKFPYPVRYRQFESIAGDITEECPKSLVCLKPLHRAKDVVLHHGQCKTGNLCREVHTLAPAEVEQLLAIVVGHLGSPSHGVGTVCLEETEREVCGKQPVPLSILASLGEEESNGSSCKFDVNSAVRALQSSVMLDLSFLMKAFDNLIGLQVPPLGVVLGLAELDHAKQVAFDVTAGNQANEVCTGKPTIHQQIVETDTSLDGKLYHLDGFLCLLHGILLDALLDTLVGIVCRESLAELLVRQSLLLVGLPAFLSVNREVEEQLAQSIGIEQSHALVAEDGLVQDMGEYLSDEFALTPAFRSIRVIDNQADWLVMRCFRTTADFSEQLEIHRIEQFAPLNVTIIHKTIEHVLLTTEQAA